MAAPPEEVRRLLYPLGLAWRADSIVSFLQEAHARFGDDLPDDAETLRTLPGVGDYVGAAIAVFAGNHAETLVDVNVVRVLGRLFGLDYSGEARRRKPFRELAARAVDPDNAARYHYAILDFAAKVCVAGIPRCNKCPFHEGERCTFYSTQMGGNRVIQSGMQETVASAEVPEIHPLTRESLLVPQDVTDY